MPEDFSIDPSEPSAASAFDVSQPQEEAAFQPTKMELVTPSEAEQAKTASLEYLGYPRPTAIIDTRPLPTEEEAQAAFDSITPEAAPEDMTKAGETVRRYLGAQKEEREGKEFDRIKGQYRDDKGLLELSKDERMRQAMDISMDPQMTLKAAINENYLERWRGRPLTDVELEASRNEYALEKWGIPKITHEQFYSKMREQVQMADKEEVVRNQLAVDLAKQALEDQLTRTYTSDTKVFEKIAKANPEVITPENRDRWFLTAAAMSDQSRAVADRIREPAAQVLDAMLKVSQGTATEADWDRAVDALRGVDQGDFNQIFDLATTAARSGQFTDIGMVEFLNNLQKRFGRDYTLNKITTRNQELLLDSTARNLEAGMTIGQMNGRLVFAQPGQPLPAGATQLDATEYGAYVDSVRRAQEGITLTRQLRNFQETRVDPVKPIFRGGFLGEAERGMYDLASFSKLLPLGLVEMIPVVGPVAGPMLVGEAIAASTYDELRLQNPNLPVESAARLSTFVGAVNAIGFKFEVDFWRGHFPGLTTMRKSFAIEGALPTLQTYAKWAGVSVLAEQSEEGIQDALEAIGRKIFADMHPREMKQESWDKVITEWVAQRPTVFFATLVPAAIGAGAATWRDIRNPARDFLQYDVLKSLGYKDPVIERILGAPDMEEAQRIARAEYHKLTAEDMIAGAKYAGGLAEGNAVTAAQEDPATPTLEAVKQPDGSYHYQVLDVDGTMLSTHTDERVANLAWSREVERMTSEQLVRETVAAAAKRTSDAGIMEEATATEAAGVAGVAPETPLTGSPFARSVGISGRELIRRLVTGEPITGETDSVAVQNARLGFVQELASAQDAANRLNVAVRVLPKERGNVLVETSHDRDGNITVSVGPEAFESLWNIAHAQGGAFQTLSRDVLTEELLHAADLAVQRDAWLKLPKDKRGAFDAFVEQNRSEIFHDVRQAREKASGKTKAAIDGALIDAYRLYFERHGEGAPILRDADKILELLERGHSRDVNHVVFAAELVRMLSQMERTGRITETGVASMVSRLKAWVMRAIDRMKNALSVAKAGEMGEMLQARLDAIAAKMEGTEQIKLAEGEPAGGTVYSAFSPRADRGAAVEREIERLRRSPAQRLSLYERMKERMTAAIGRHNAALAKMAAEGKSETTRQAMIRSIAEYNTLLRSLPPEVRGRVGGFGELARIGKSEESLSKFFTQQIQKIDKVLEQVLRKEYRARIDNLLKRYKPKKVSGVARSKLGDAQTTVDRIRVVSKMTNDEVALAQESIDEELSGSMKLTPEREAELTADQIVLQTFGAIEDRTAAELAVAHAELVNTIKTGRAEFGAKEQQRLEKYRANRDSIMAGLPKGTAAGIAAKEVTSIKDFAKSVILSIYNFSQVIREVMPKSAKVMVERWDRESARADAGSQDYVRFGSERFAQAIQSAIGTKSAIRAGNLIKEMQALTIDGKDGKASKFQAIQYLLSWSQKDVRERMERQGWTQDQMDVFERATADPASMAVKRLLREEYDRMYQDIDRVYFRVYGMHLPKVELYAPTRYFHAGQEIDINPFGGPLATAGTTPSFAFARVAHNAGIRQSDAMTVYLQHLHQVAHFINYAELIREIRGTMQNPDVKMAVQQRLGPMQYDIVTRWIDALARNGSNKGNETRLVQAFMKHVVSAKAISALILNPKTIAMQVDSMLRFTTAIPPRKLMGAVLDGTWVANIPKAWYSDTVQRRIYGGMNPQMQFIMQKGNFTPSFFIELVRKGMMPIQLADAGFTSVSSSVVYTYAYREAIDSGLPEAEAEAIALAEMDNAVHKFSQPTGVTSKSILEVNTGGTMKLLMLFMSDPRLKSAVMAEATLGVSRGENVTQNIMRIVAVEAMALVSQYVACLYRDWATDDDDEDIWTKAGFARAALLAPVQGVFTIGNMADSTLAWMLGQKIRRPGAIDPLTEGMQKVQSVWRNLDDLLNTGDPEAMRKEWDAVLKSAGLLGGPSLASLNAVTNFLKLPSGIYENWQKKED
jgi:hypothetical protein